MVNIEDPEFEKLLAFLADKDQFVFLDTNRQDNENTESLLFLDPISRMVCTSKDNLHEYLQNLQSLLDQGYFLAGWIGYEFGSLYAAGVGQVRSSSPGDCLVLADLGVFLKPLRFRHDTGENNFPDTNGYALTGRSYKISEIMPNMSEAEFVEALHKVRAYIGAGDTYQVNYTMKLNFVFEGSVEKWYQTLRRNQSVSYGAYIRNGDEKILSLSPEMFFRKDGNVVTAKPMKGTLHRGNTCGEERNNCEFLHNDIKNRSENVMIVDLLRNDLARLMFNKEESRVWVSSLFDVESYESLLQMTSTVQATCAESAGSKVDMTKLFQALFPCGSITGAPKIRTMEIIDELEKDRRGVYTGAIGYFSPEGKAIFNVPIRTVHLKGNVGEMGIGAGITYDSVPEEEWRESLLKGRFLTHSEPDFYLFETILWQPDEGYWLFAAHLERLGEAADYFKFHFSRDKVSGALQEHAKSFSSSCMRVRLTLRKDGRVEISSMKCEAPSAVQLPAEPSPLHNMLPKIAIATSDLKPPTGPWCFHKTSRRESYNSASERARAEGLFDYIFSNEAGEITEGAITNIIIYKEGAYQTPPLGCGLLNGVMRRWLMEQHCPPLVEKKLQPQDLYEAEAVFVCNSVRGVVQVELRQ